MIQFVLKKIFWGLFVLITVVVLVSSIIYASPVDPARLSFGQQSDQKTIEKKKQQLGLDRGLFTQLKYYLRDLSPIAKYSHEDFSNFEINKYISLKETPHHHYVLKGPYFRESYQSGRSVWSILKEAIPKTIILALSSFLIATIFGILFGIVAALKKDTWVDKSLLMFSSLGYALPSYVSAMILALVFGYWWSHLTGLNVQGSLIELNDIGDEVLVLKNLLLPSIALGIRPLAVVTQLTRASVLDVLHEPFIRTAVAKGLSFKNVIKDHTLRNALNPIATSLSGWLASLFAGAFFVENVFNFKGLGTVTVNALLNYDIPVVLGAVIFIALVFVVINIIVDILYALIDPRISIN